MTQTTAETVLAGPPVDGQVYAEILQFYAHHMQLLDAGAAEEWADGFTEDGVFAQNVKPEPWSGRSTIATSMRRGVDRLAGRQVQRRHWFGMVAATAVDPDTVRSRYYAVVFETPRGGKASVYLSTTGEDLLVRQDGGWRIQRRDIAHDGV
ncbi:nuclear transport factor 2 family protein [Streptomyces sp. NPDC002680]|uniref:nuclear transport factor 2 family protein n=1 Tax=Streptomyces sp. NPDC002680 TaxID=3364659 RepID=UPI003688CF55